MEQFIEEEVGAMGTQKIKPYLLDLDQKLIALDVAFMFELHETTLLPRCGVVRFVVGVERRCSVVDPSIRGKERLKYKILL